LIRTHELCQYKSMEKYKYAGQEADRVGQRSGETDI